VRARNFHIGPVPGSDHIQERPGTGRRRDGVLMRGEHQHGAAERFQPRLVLGRGARILPRTTIIPFFVEIAGPLDLEVVLLRVLPAGNSTTRTNAVTARWSLSCHLPRSCADAGTVKPHLGQRGLPRQDRTAVGHACKRSILRSPQAGVPEAPPVQHRRTMPKSNKLLGGVGSS
jgi:hypothetical protein